MRLTIAAFAALTATSVAALAAGSADDVLKANKAATGGAAWDAKAAVSIDTDYAGQGLTGTTHSVNDLHNGRSVSAFKVGPAAGANGFDGKTPWQRDTSGTITEQDCLDTLFRRHLTSYPELTAAMRSGQLRPADAVRRGVSELPIPRDQVLDEFSQAAVMRGGFAEFLRRLVAGGGRAAVISAGFREGIERAWRREGLSDVELFAGELAGGRRGGGLLAVGPGLGSGAAVAVAGRRGSPGAATRRRCRRAGTREAVDQGGLLSARVIQPQRAAQVFQPVAREICQGLGQADFARGDQGVHDAVLGPPVGDIHAAQVDGCQQFVTGEEFEEGAFGCHADEHCTPGG